MELTTGIGEEMRQNCVWKNVDVLNFVSNKYDPLIKSNCNFFVVHR